MNRMKAKLLCGMFVFAMAIPSVGYTGAIENVKAQTVSEYDADSYDADGYDSDGYDSDSDDSDSDDADGYGSDGYDAYGYDSDGYDRDGYDADGYDRNGYDKEGYYKDGYNKEGYDKEGYDREGYNKDGLDLEGYHKGELKFIGYVKFKNQRTQTLEGGYVLNWTPKNKIAISSIRDRYGNKMKRSDYKYTVKKKNVNKNGYGDYEVVFKLSKKYQNRVEKADVQILPKIEIESMASRLDSNYVYNVIYFIGESAYEQKIDGIEYKYGELKEKKIKKGGKVISHYTEGKFAKIYKKGTIKLKKNRIETFDNKMWKAKGFRLAAIEKEKRSSVYECDARAYVIIGGKKRYTKNWKNVVSLPQRNDYEMETHLSADY